MSDKTAGLTKSLVSEKVDEVVKSSQASYQSAFAVPRLRQKLIVRIMQHVSRRATGSATTRNLSDDINSGLYFSQEREHISGLIEESMIDILREENAWQYLPDSFSSRSQPLEPSHWFG